MIQLEKEEIENMRQQLEDEDEDFRGVDAGHVRIIRNAIIKQIAENNDVMEMKTRSKHLEIEALRPYVNKTTRLINLYENTHLIKRAYFDRIYIYIEFNENLVYAVSKPYYYD